MFFFSGYRKKKTGFSLTHTIFAEKSQKTNYSREKNTLPLHRKEGSFDGRLGGASLDHVQGKGDGSTTPDRGLKQKLDKKEHTKKKMKRVKGNEEEQTAAFGVKLVNKKIVPATKAEEQDSNGKKFERLKR